MDQGLHSLDTGPPGDARGDQKQTYGNKSRQGARNFMGSDMGSALQNAPQVTEKYGNCSTPTGYHYILSPFTISYLEVEIVPPPESVAKSGTPLSTECSPIILFNALSARVR